MLMLVSINAVCISVIAQSATLSAMETALQESLFALTITLQFQGSSATTFLLKQGHGDRGVVPHSFCQQQAGLSIQD